MISEVFCYFATVALLMDTLEERMVQKVLH